MSVPAQPHVTLETIIDGVSVRQTSYAPLLNPQDRDVAFAFIPSM